MKLIDHCISSPVFFYLVVQQNSDQILDLENGLKSFFSFLFISHSNDKISICLGCCSVITIIKKIEFL